MSNGIDFFQSGYRCRAFFKGLTTHSRNLCRELAATQSYYTHSITLVERLLHNVFAAKDKTVKGIVAKSLHALGVDIDDKLAVQNGIRQRVIGTLPVCEVEVLDVEVALLAINLQGVSETATGVEVTALSQLPCQEKGGGEQEDVSEPGDAVWLHNAVLQNEPGSSRRFGRTPPATLSHKLVTEPPGSGTALTVLILLRAEQLTSHTSWVSLWPLKTTKSRTRTPSDFSHTQKLGRQLEVVEQ